ncbi:hypothetical protein J7K27_06935 [Candidatus Bathyarchaeota archaeon]|nr:hypothetical protein [Candidatus Bathyarchaeota archaeon]
MPRKKSSKKKTKIPEEASSLAEKDEETEILKAKLESIKDMPEVIGYILRNSRSATIDAKDPTKIIDYAMLSSATIETAEKLIEIFQLGEAEKIVLEGNTAKLLSLSIGENSISVFMEKNAKEDRIFRNLT